MRLLVALVVVVILALAGLLGYAYFGDMTADPQETRLPVQLDLGAAPVPAPASAPASAPTNGTAPDQAGATAPATAATPAPTTPQAGQNDLD